MVVILSPSKDMSAAEYGKRIVNDFTLPPFLAESAKLMNQLKQLSPIEIADQMNVNERLALLNYQRFQQWNQSHSQLNSECSVYAYTGEAYRGLKADIFNQDELFFSQKVLRIFSGLYGILRPLDLIQPYRLELGLGIQIKGIGNLYKYWKNLVAIKLNKAIAESPGEKVLVNLASEEYSSLLNFKELGFPVVTPSFKEEKSGQLKTVTIYTKKARGLMARFIIENKIETREELKAFSEEGYYYENQLSRDNAYLFVR